MKNQILGFIATLLITSSVMAGQYSVAVEGGLAIETSTPLSLYDTGFDLGLTGTGPLPFMGLEWKIDGTYARLPFSLSDDDISFLSGMGGIQASFEGPYLYLLAGATRVKTFESETEFSLGYGVGWTFLTISNYSGSEITMSADLRAMQVFVEGDDLWYLTPNLVLGLEF